MMVSLNDRRKTSLLIGFFSYMFYCDGKSKKPLIAQLTNFVSASQVGTTFYFAALVLGSCRNLHTCRAKADNVDSYQNR